MTDNTDFKARVQRAAKVLATDKAEAAAQIKRCQKALQQATTQVDEAKARRGAIASRIAALQGQQQQEDDKLQAARNKAQASFDEAMAGDDEAKQVAAAKQLSAAEIGVTQAKLLGPNALRLRALTEQEGREAALVTAATEQAAVAQQALNQAAYEQALVDYDGAISDVIHAGIRVAASYQALEKKPWIHDFFSQVLWMSSGHRSVSHLQNAPVEPVLIASTQFNSLLYQGVAAES